MNRRTFLHLTGAGAGALLGVLAGCGSGGRNTPVRDWSAENPLRIPPELRPYGPGHSYDLELRPGRTAFLAGHPTPTWGVNGSYLGPTLRMQQGDRVTVNVQNNLPEATTLHWHGMRLPPAADGGPHQSIPAIGRWQPSWDVVNAASTSWYHPHPHGATAQHVFKGVAGMIIIDDDDTRPALPRDYGVDDIPVILQDRSIDADGQVRWETASNFGQLGTDMLVNGTMNAYLDVTTRRVRLRLLNGSNARLYHVGLADGRRFAMIAGDDGLLPAPVELERVTLGPGERAEIVVTCAPGERVIMDTTAGDEGIDEGTYALLELRSAASLEDVPEVPTRLGGALPIIPPVGATVRHFELQGHDAINGREMDLTRIDEVVPANAVEIWEVENDVYSHNFHVHGVSFTILDRDGEPPHAWESGRKDTVHVPEKSSVRLAVQFSSFVDPALPYMYHCHILRHEDDGMMGQFLVVEPGTEAGTPRSIPAPGGGHSGHPS
ncbi:MAG TPA: multicopper oxidase domain-containing protein [Microlunatus sp.]